jgi:hypothetical protein
VAGFFGGKFLTKRLHVLWVVIDNTDTEFSQKLVLSRLHPEKECREMCDPCRISITKLNDPAAPEPRV